MSTQNHSTTQSNQPALDPWLTLQQASTLVQIHQATLRREIRRARLRAARVGGRRSIRLRRSWLDAWLETSTTPTEVA